ncbi:MAG: RtcB family protein, partial [Isosphaeraceae bacterium]
MAQSGAYTGPLEKVGPCQWKIPMSYREDMRVDGLIFADDQLIEQIKQDQGPEQVVNVATLPGIQKASLAMPDIHWGYGFCIGGVAATDPEQGGVISPGGVGYDINCGVRLLRSNLEWCDVKDKIRPLVDQLFRDIPTGVGQRGRFVFHKPELVKLMEQGVSYVVEKGFGSDRDLAFTEAEGRLAGADPGRVSDRAIVRGADQCGTLGSGNHFLEVQVVDRVVDHAAAAVMGLREGQITVLIHSGSRGLGYQVCDDYLKVFKNAPRKYGFTLPDQ